MSLEQIARTVDTDKSFEAVARRGTARGRRAGIVIDIAGVSETKIYPPISVEMKNAAAVADKDDLLDRPELFAVRHAVILSYN